MCEPVSIISGVLGAASSVAGHVGQQNAADAANAGRIANYKYQLKVRENNWMRTKSNWENDKINYEESVADNSFAAQEGYARAQRQLNEQFKAAAFSEQGDMVKLLESTGVMAASGQTGRSAQRVDDSMMAAFGRNNSAKAASLASSKEGYQQQVEDIRRQQRDENESAFDQVAFAPIPDMAPQKPQMEKGPSGLGLAVGLAGAGLGAYAQHQALKAPKAFGNEGAGSLKIPQMPSSYKPSYAPSDWGTLNNRYF